jgi:hypothetical protein
MENFSCRFFGSFWIFSFLLNKGFKNLCVPKKENESLFTDNAAIVRVYSVLASKEEYNKRHAKGDKKRDFFLESTFGLCRNCQ